MTTHTDSFRNYVKDPANFNQGQGNNYDLIFPIWFTETQWNLQTVAVKASPSAQYENDSYHRGKNTIYFELDYPGSEITSCRMVVNCDNAVRVLQQSDGESTGYSQGNGRLLLTNAGMANSETGHFTLKTGKNRFIFEIANHGDPHGGPGYLLACAVTSDGTNNNLIFHTGYNFCKWGGYTSTSTTYDSLGQGWKWKNGFFSNTSAPVLSGVPSDTTITDGDSYTIPTVTATDTTDGSVTVTVINGGFTTSGTSSHTTGSYTITFTATDSNAVTTTASYVLTVETSVIYFPTGQYVKMWTYFTGYYHGWLTLASHTMDLLDETYDPNNTSIRDTDTGLIRSSHRTKSQTSVHYTYSFTRVIIVDDDEVNVAYIRLKWASGNIRSDGEGTWDSWNSGRWVISSLDGGLSYIEWMNGDNLPGGAIEVVRVYYLTTSGRTEYHRFYDGMNFIGSPNY